MELSPTPEDGSPVRKARSRSLHAAVISLELKGEDRCLVRMDVSFGVTSLAIDFFFSLFESAIESLDVVFDVEREKKTSTEAFLPLSFIPAPSLRLKRSPPTQPVPFPKKNSSTQNQPGPLARVGQEEEQRRLAPRQRPLDLVVALPSRRVAGPRPAPAAGRALEPLESARGARPVVAPERVRGLRRPQRPAGGGAFGRDADRDAAREAAAREAAEEAGVLPERQR